MPLDGVLGDACPSDSAAGALNNEHLACEPGTITTVETVSPCAVTRAPNQESSYKRSKCAKLGALADLFQSEGSRKQCANTLNGKPLATRDQRNSRKPSPIQAWLATTQGDCGVQPRIVHRSRPPPAQ